MMQRYAGKKRKIWPWLLLVSLIPLAEYTLTKIKYGGMKKIRFPKEQIVDWEPDTLKPHETVWDKVYRRDYPGDIRYWVDTTLKYNEIDDPTNLQPYTVVWLPVVDKSRKPRQF